MRILFFTVRHRIERLFPANSTAAAAALNRPLGLAPKYLPDNGTVRFYECRSRASHGCRHEVCVSRTFSQFASRVRPPDLPPEYTPVMPDADNTNDGKELESSRTVGQKQDNDATHDPRIRMAFRSLKDASSFVEKSWRN